MPEKPRATDADLRVHIPQLLRGFTETGITTPYIVKHLQRRFRVGYNRINATLNMLVEEGLLTKVELRGVNVWKNAVGR